MNQFHTPSFGDEVFELNETPTETSNQASRRMLSLDQSTLNDEEEMAFDYCGSAQMTQQQQQPEQTQQQQQQAPSKPLAPFALFFRDTVTAIKQQNPACSLEQISVIVQTMWDSLDATQKNIYNQRHELDKRNYVRQLRDYRQQLPETGSTTEAVATVVPSTVDVAKPVEEQPQQPVPQTQTSTPTPPEQIQLLTEAARVTKCTREQCNKPAIINPDWEDEYCSNECVVIHCRNVFNEWALSLKNSTT